MAANKAELTRKKRTDVAVGFAQGYICAVCTLIQFYGCVTTEVKELWNCNPYKWEDLPLYNIDVHDLDILNKYREDLTK